MKNEMVDRILKGAKMVQFNKWIAIKYWNGFYYENEEICSIAIIKKHITINAQRITSNDYIYFNNDGEIINERCIGNLSSVQCEVLNKMHNWCN